MLILRIRQAESAMADGRLDEAFELALAEDVRAHRRGQRVIGRLARLLVVRGQDHLAAQRLQQAMADCVKAETLGGNLPEAAALRQAVAQAMWTQQRSRRRRADAVAAAREHVENGRLSMGEQLLADADLDSARAETLRGDLAARREAAAGTLRRAEAAMAHEDWAAAIDELTEARHAHASNDRVAELAARLTEQVNRRIRAAIEQGRLDLADLLIRRLAPFAGQTIETRELRRLIEQCRLAGECIEQGRPRQAGEILRRLGSILPGAGWIRDAIEGTQQAAAGMEQLRGGPLALLGAGRSDLQPEASINAGAQTGPAPLEGAFAQPTAGARLPGRWMIHVDGVGSFLVLRSGQVTIGPSGSSRHPDLALMADANLPPTTVERVDDDYFLSSDGYVCVNDRPTSRKLLADGDKIALSRRCRIRFGLPHAASTSAVLDLSGTRLPQGGVRRVILLDRSVVLGPGPSSHIRADQLAAPVVLTLRDGRLSCSSKEAVTVDDRPIDRQAGISMNAHVRVGPVSFVVTAA